MLNGFKKEELWNQLQSRDTDQGAAVLGGAVVLTDAVVQGEVAVLEGGPEMTTGRGTTRGGAGAEAGAEAEAEAMTGVTVTGTMRRIEIMIGVAGLVVLARMTTKDELKVVMMMSVAAAAVP